MRIVCPQCQAAYKVDLPDLDDSGMEVKCAKCQNIFQVKKEGSTPQGSAKASQANVPSGKSPDQAVDGQDDKQEDKKEEAPLPEEYLEELMDEFVQKEVAQQTPARPSEPKPPDASKNMGSLIDDIIQEEPGSQKEEDASQEVPFTEQEISEKSDSLDDPALDEMWEKAVQGQKPPEEPGSELGWSEAFADQDKIEAQWKKPDDQESTETGDEPATVEEVEPKLEMESPPLEISPVEDPDAPTWTDAFADQEQTESRWQQAQDQDKALAEEDLQLAEEQELSLDEQWSRALTGQVPSKSSLEEALKKDLKDSSSSEESPPAQPPSDKPKTPEPQTADTVAADATTGGSTDDSFDDDWMRALATQTTPESSQPPEKLEIKPAADSATETESKSETDSKTKEEPPAAPPVPVPEMPEPVSAEMEPAEMEPPEEPAVGAVMESEDAFNTDELWEQAFTEPSKSGTPEPAAAVEEDLQFPDQAADEKEDEKEKDPRPAPIIFAQDKGDLLFDADEALKSYDESAYADDDDDLYDYKPKKRSRGPLGIPSGKKGDWVIAGFVAALLLIVGGIYFTVETFAPKELTDLQVADTTVPEGLTPKEDPTQAPVEEPDTTATTPSSGAATSRSLEAGGDDETLITELAKSKILGESEQNRFPVEGGFDDVLAGGSNSVMMSTIMPIAYNPTDIRVLSFSLEMQMSDAASARLVREALPIYEKIMINTVEDFLRRKFYDDVLYVKEKLQKRLLVAMNKSIQGGRVKKTKFTDFAIQ